MKTLSRITLAAAFAAVFTLANNASADGIAASPKVQQMLNERAARSIVSAPVSTVTLQTSGREGITGSPKVLQILAERKVSGASETDVVSAGYNPTGADGVTASPKLRAQINERSAPVIIAPLK